MPPPRYKSKKIPILKDRDFFVQIYLSFSLLFTPHKGIVCSAYSGGSHRPQSNLYRIFWQRPTQPYLSRSKQ